MSRAHQRRIFVHDLVCEAEIGVHPHEKNRLSFVHIDLDALMDDTPHDDLLENTVCYDQLAAIAHKITRKGRVNLAETLAEQIANACLAETNITRISVCIRKRDARQDAQNAGIEITRDKKS